HRWVIGRPASRLRINSNEPKISQIEPVDKNVNDTNRIVLVNPILQAFRKQRALSSILPLDEALHLIPRISRGNPTSRVNPDAAFSHSLGQIRPCCFSGVDSGLSPDSCRTGRTPMTAAL